MAKKIRKRLPEVKTLYEILPQKKPSSGNEFARIVNLLIFHRGRRNNANVTLFDDRAGDWYGLDVFEKAGRHMTGYQHKFYPCPLNAKHRRDIEDSIKITLNACREKKVKLKKWILVTPQDFVESATRKTGGDVTWFEGLKNKYSLPFEIEHWGHTQLISLFLESPAIGLFYYPELFPDGHGRRKTIQDFRARYDKAFAAQYKYIEFVGMSVYKEEASRHVPMQNIYIPLTTIPGTSDDNDPNVIRNNPLELLKPGSHHVVLGDPGSGKTTMLKFLSLAGQSPELRKRYDAQPDDRLPVLVTLRRYADEIKKQDNLCLVNYIIENIQADFSLPGIALEFLEYYLETGRTILLFDGLDELPDPSFKKKIRDRICTLSHTYPGNTTIVTSRIYGYEGPVRFDDKEFTHHKIAKLREKEIEQFVRDWYAVRIESKKTREEYINSLLSILGNKEHRAIRTLAGNPLLLTIIVLVHRIDAVLPDERVVLYRKCTETLLNTWHTWKFHDLDKLHKAKVDRQNLQRMQGIAYWMQHQAGSNKALQQAVIPYKDLHMFLTQHINTEKPRNPDHAPEDIATTFIEFVQDRAGLLIEVGDRQFSFVHLTFQEYLTAAHISTLSELKGMEKAWDKEIADHWQDPRWHEVIRLLVADCRSDESQKFLVEKLLHTPEIDVNAAYLLGGLLLDNISAAQIYETDILKQLLIVAVNAETRDELGKALSLIRLYIVKGDAARSALVQTIRSLVEQMTGGDERTRFRLIVRSLPEICDEVIERLVQEDKRILELEDLFFGTEEKQSAYTYIQEEMDFLFDAFDYLIYFSAYGNYVFQIFQPLSSILQTSKERKKAFNTLMSTMIWKIWKGPPPYYTSYLLLFSL